MLKKINKIVFLLLIATLSITSCAQVNKNNFIDLSSKFRDGKLPLLINRDNIFSFNEIIYNEKDESFHPNLYSTIDSNFYSFFNITKPVVREVSYRALYKYKYKNIIVLFIVSDFHEEGEQIKSLFTIYTFSSNEKLIDSQLIAGYDLDNSEQFCVITEDFNIFSTNYKFLPEYDDELLIHAEESKFEYYISSNGEIILKKSLSRKGKFQLINNMYKWFEQL